MADDIRANADLGSALDEAEARFRDANPKSLARHREAGSAMPGGNTRTVLHYPPFPLAWAKGEGAVLTDIDGHRYTDFLGEFPYPPQEHFILALPSRRILAARSGSRLQIGELPKALRHGDEPLGVE